jgi:hypothetical protein
MLHPAAERDVEAAWVAAFSRLIRSLCDSFPMTPVLGEPIFRRLGDSFSRDICAPSFDSSWSRHCMHDKVGLQIMHS